MEAKELSDNAQKVISQASNWSFEGDCMILQWMEKISETLESHAKDTLKSIDQLTTNINRAQIDLENTQNSLSALQYSQYVEMRCQEDTSLENETVLSIQQQQHHQEQRKKPNRQEVLQVFLENNMKMLHNCHDKFNFLEESDEDEGNIATAENCIYQPRNPYNERLLPHIFGTKMWKEQSHVGLEDETLLDYSGDEKSEVYSISSSSVESIECETPESHLTANTSQWTSSASLNNELNTPIKTLKAIPNISNTPSISSLPMDVTNNNAVIRNEPQSIVTNGNQNTENLQSSSNTIKRPTLNLFDDNDYKNLITEIVDKTSKSNQFKADSSKIDLFADNNDSLSNPKMLQTQNSVQAQKIPSAKLFDDSSRKKPTHDLFQDFQKTEEPNKTKETTIIKTKLSGKNLFDDDDEDTDFLNIFAKSSKNLLVEPTNTLSGSDVLDRRESVKAQIVDDSKTAGASNLIKTKKSLFFDDDDDDDDFFVQNLSKSNVIKSLEQPKTPGFPTYLPTEPPEDIVEKHKETNVKSSLITVDNEEHEDDFTQIFGNKKLQFEKTNVVSNLFADNENTQNATENTANFESRKNDEEVKQKIDIGKNQTVDIQVVKPLINNEIVEDDDFEALFPTKNKQQPEANKIQDILNDDVARASESSSFSTIKVNDESESVTSKTESFNTVVEKEALLQEHGESNKYLTETFNENPKALLETDEPESNKAFDKNDEHLVRNEVFLKSKIEKEPSTKENVSAWMTEPPLDDRSTFTEINDEDDDFLSIFNKQMPKEQKNLADNVKETTQPNLIPQTSIETEPEVLEATKPNLNDQSKEIIERKNEFEAIVETKQNTDQGTLITDLKPIETNSNDQTTAKSETASANKTLETLETNNHIKIPAFDSFSPLFLDEPPDDDDFLQAISSNTNVTSQYNAENDFYDTSKENISSDVKNDHTQINTGYHIRLFDELPPEDNEEEITKNDDTSKSNTLSNLFDTDKLANSNEVLTEEAGAAYIFDEQPIEIVTTNASIVSEKVTESKTKKVSAIVFDEQPINVLTAEVEKSTVTTKVKAIEKPLEGANLKVTTSNVNVSKLKLPKIDINVQALLPNASGGVIRKPTKTHTEQENTNDALKNNNKTQEIKIISEANVSEQSHLLPNLCKSRVRVPVKRKSSTRAGRQESYRQTLQAESKANQYQSNASFENETIADGYMNDNINKTSLQPKSLQSVSEEKQAATSLLVTKQTANTTNLLKTNAAATKQLEAPKILTTPTESTASIQSTQQTVISSTSTLFSDNEEDDDDFFSKLAQPKLPKAVIEKSAKVAPVDSDDDDLFASNIAKVESVKVKATSLKPNTAALSSNVTSSKPNSNLTTKTLMNKSTSKALFDSDSSNEDDNNANDLFKASRSTKTAFQTATSAAKSISAVAKPQSKPKSLFSDSEDDDDDIFGSSVSKTKSVHVESITTKNPLPSKTQKTLKEKTPTTKTADNPLADLLN